MRATPATLAACVLLLACGSSPPVQFLALQSVRPEAAPVDRASVPVRVVAVHIPGVLDRQEMVRESTSTQLAISDRDRWAAPLGDMLVRVLTEDLASRLPSGMVIFPQQPAPPRIDDIVVDILKFDRDSSGTVIFDGSWSLVPDGSDSVLAGRQVRLTRAAHALSYAEQAKAMSEIVGVLADSIATGIRAEGSAASN